MKSKSRIRRIFTALTVTLSLIMAGSLTAFASPDTSIPKEATARNISLTLPCNDGGLISNESRDYTLTVTEATTYTFSLATTAHSGSLWVIFEKAGGSPRYIDRNINGSFQQRYTLSTGTYYLKLANPSGLSTFSFSFHKTFS